MDELERLYRIRELAQDGLDEIADLPAEYAALQALFDDIWDLTDLETK